MKSAFLGLGLMGMLMLSGSAEAHCGCGYYAPVTYVHPVYSAPVYSAPVVSAPVHSPTQALGSVAYVNRLANPIDRGTYTLQYAVHLTNGRVLFTDYIPSGHGIRGTEVNSVGGRRMNAANNGNGLITISDPASNEVVAQTPGPG